MNIKRLAGSLLTGEKIPRQELEKGLDLYTPRSSYALEPLVASLKLGGSPSTLQAIKEALSLQKSINTQSVDVGAFEIDLLLNKLGISSNLASVRRRPHIAMPIAEDAYYKRQAKAGPSGGPSTDVEFIRLTDTPMMDWDLPDPYHANTEAVTVRNLGDVEQLTREYVRNHPESALRVYQTPGGYRAWELGKQMNPTEFSSRFNELNVDPYYAMIAQQTPSSPHEGPMSFASRISHKPGRTDWVAQPILELSGSKASPVPRSAELVKVLHDDPIRRMYLGAEGVSPDAINLLKQHLPSASKSLQRELTRRFRL